MVAVARVLSLCALVLVLPSLMPSGLAFAQVRLEFVYPTNGQKLYSKGSYDFKVNPIPNALGFSWTISQNGKVVAERITGNEFVLTPGTSEHSKIVPGRPFQVRVQAMLEGKRIEPATITISAVTQQPEPVRAAQPTPSAPAGAEGRPVFLYPADKQIVGDRFPWQFKVQPIANAQEFSWSVFQHGRMLSEQIKRGTKGNEFEISPGGRAYSQIDVGDPIEVRVRALIAGKWTDPTIITVRGFEPTPVKAPQHPSAQPPGFTFSDAVLLFLFFLPFPLIYVIVKYRRLAAVEHRQRVEAAYKRVLAKLPKELAGAMKQPAEQLFLDLLSDEGAFQNRRLKPQLIEEFLSWWIHCLLYDKEKQLHLPNLLASGSGREATFSAPLFTLHTDVAYAVGRVVKSVMPTTPAPPPIGYTFYRLADTVWRHFCRINGLDPTSHEPPRKQLKYPQQFNKDGFSDAEVIGQFLEGTPFVNFLKKTTLDVSIPHRSRFEHMHIVGGTGHGKTQLMQYLILHDLPHIATGGRSVIVIDSKGSLINEILHLAAVGAMAERVVFIDPNEYTPALNLFDFGLDRLKGYADERERKRVLNAAIELYKYMFGALLGAETTPRQTLIFEFLAKLVMVVPGATIDTLLDFLKRPELTHPYIRKLDEDGQQFFETEFFDSEYDGNRKQLATRLWEVKSKAELARMFKAERNKLDLFDAMNRGSLILINTNKRYLSPEGSQIFGRFFIALIGQATRERELGDQHQLRDTFVYIDEAHEYFDQKLGNLFEQARQFQVGMVIAHQHLGQFQNELRGTVTSNTSVKIAGGVSYDDARDFAKEMWCKPEFLLGMQKYQAKKETEFACYIKNIETLNHAIPFRVPLGAYDDQRKITAAGLASLIERNRARYGATHEKPPEKPKDDDSPLGDPELL